MSERDFSKLFGLIHLADLVLTDFLVIVVITALIGLIMLYRCAGLFIRLSDPVMKINHALHPELNQGPADLQSAALTIELCTLGFCIQSNKKVDSVHTQFSSRSTPMYTDSHRSHQKGNREEHIEYISVARVQPRTHKTA